MTKFYCNHITSSGCGKTTINCVIDTKENTYELSYYSNWMGMPKSKEFKITGDVLYVDCTENPVSLHAYLCYKPIRDIRRTSYMSAIIEIISFPKLRECIPGTREHEKFYMSNSSDEFNVNGIILAEVCYDVGEDAFEVELVKNVNNCSLTITTM